MSVIVGTLRDAVGLFGPTGETVTDSEIVPVNPFTLVRVTFEYRVNPDPIMRVEGIAPLLKSLTLIINGPAWLIFFRPKAEVHRVEGKNPIGGALCSIIEVIVVIPGRGCAGVLACFIL